MFTISFSTVVRFHGTIIIYSFPGTTIREIVTQKYQFAYSPSAPVLDHLRELAENVLWRWNLEQNGHTDVGRVLPKNYLWFDGDGEHNYFRDNYLPSRAHIWDYSLDSPYDI